MNNNCSLYERYRAITRPNLSSGCWHVQTVYGGAFPARSWRGTAKDIQAMLEGQNWIACRAPEDGQIDWIGFDVDAKTEVELHDAVERYWALRRLLGMERIPLVYRTPSGRGLRVLYRIPRTPIVELITGREEGLVANVLRGAGLPVENGQIEIYPQSRQADRLMLGKRMPLVDPDTLEVLPDTAPSDTWDENAFERALEFVESWFAKPCDDLIAHLESLPAFPRMRLVRTHAEGETGDDESLFNRDGVGLVRFGARLEHLLSTGLPGASSRYESEFLVALAIAVSPKRFARYGIGPAFSARDIARATSCWLSQHHNNASREWTRSVKKTGSVEKAVALWTSRYLQRNRNSGDHLIDRVMRALESVDPLSTPVRQLVPDEICRIMAIAERHFGAGAQRYRFETWAHACQRAVREIAHYTADIHHQRAAQPGTESYRIISPAKSAGSILVEIAAAWMMGWPYGSGRDEATRQTRYIWYRQTLETEGLLRKVRSHYNYGPDAHGTGANRATTYRVVAPAPATLRDVPVAPWVLARAIEGITGSRDKLDIAEAYHILHITGLAIDLRRRYGYSRSEWIWKTAGRIQENIAVILEGADQPQLLAA